MRISVHEIKKKFIIQGCVVTNTNMYFPVICFAIVMCVVSCNDKPPHTIHAPSFAVRVPYKSVSHLELDSMNLPLPSEGAYTHYWRYHAGNKSVAEAMGLFLVNENTVVARLNKVNELKPGTYVFVLYRGYLTRVEYGLYNVTIVGGEEWEEEKKRHHPQVIIRGLLDGKGLFERYLIIRKALSKATSGWFNHTTMPIDMPVLNLLGGIRAIGNIAQGLIIYYHAYRDYTVTEEVFFSSVYIKQWVYYGLSIDQYTPIGRETLEKLRFKKEEEEEDTSDRLIPLPWVEYYFLLNRNPHATQVISVIEFWYSMVLFYLSFITLIFVTIITV